MRFLIRLAGLGLLLWGVWAAWGTWKFLDDARPAKANVVWVGESRIGIGQEVDVEIAGDKKRSIVGFLPLVFLPEPVEEGDTLDVLFVPTDPEQMRLDDPVHIWMFPGGAIALGLLLRAIVRRPRRRVTSAGADADEAWRKGQKKLADEAHEIRSANEYTKLASRESAEDHARETNYTPAVRRRR